jgi:aspartate kinase
MTGVAERMFRALADAGINILMITTSEIKISVLVSKDQGLPALRTLHRVFELDKPPADKANGAPAAPHGSATDAAAVVARLERVQGMEDLTIDDVKLDDTQARVTVSEVPDTPGLAAAVFEGVAAGGIFVDMIVQSFGVEGMANLSFTVPRTDLNKAVQVAQQLASKLKCGPVTHSPRVAKLSVSGIGMRSHTSVAIRMFRSLAETGINVEMINTSEVRVNVVIDGDKGKAGLACLQKAFSCPTPRRCRWSGRSRYRSRSHSSGCRHCDRSRRRARKGAFRLCWFGRATREPITRLKFTRGSKMPRFRCPWQAVSRCSANLHRFRNLRMAR